MDNPRELQFEVGAGLEGNEEEGIEAAVVLRLHSPELHGGERITLFIPIDEAKKIGTEIISAAEHAYRDGMLVKTLQDKGMAFDDARAFLDSINELAEGRVYEET